MFTLKKSLATLVGRRLRWTRSFLSEAYGCDDVWQQRLDCSLLRKVEPEVLYHKLSTTMEHGSKQISAVDLDVFANSLTDNSYLDELEELTHKFRLSAQTDTMLPSTHHAVVRLLLASNCVKDLVRILKDRLNYGIFPDYYLCNLLMDRFIKGNDIRNAIVIVSNQMLQEELDNDITKAMGLYTCLKYITNPTEWEEAKIETEETINNDDDDEEDRRVRVDFLRNPYFDNHFDLTDSDHLVGKTMLAISSKIDNTILGNSFKTLGLAYYNQWNDFRSHIEKLNSSIYPETVELAVTAIDKRAPENAEELKDALAKLQIENKSLTDETNNFVKEAVTKNEETEIQNQKIIYKQWESFRREELSRYLDHLNKLKRLQKVQQAKQDLKEKEQLLFFFDNEHKHDLVKEEKLKRMKKTVIKDKSLKDDLTYVPPEIRKPGFKRD
ncbi:28S ribosomal protein S27, mitochondrial [Melanaphis sacchari]|uniref:28S ribosomal protein S27, mitochondrial n=1 Tax=Melanaphis sacchari TaxID=742174 RepID=A0A2H8TY09_9HEMI|nr:28S ribosomal protein S27, mitochondrial [Melanaphis sacchari]